MKVEVIRATPFATKVLADIASICYGHNEAKNHKKLIENLNKSGHHSVFEHAYYTFKIEGISRACLAQLTRHRHASYTVRSQRYCDEGEFKVDCPDDIWDNKELRNDYYKLMETIQHNYNNLRANGVKREDARSILPQSTLTDLYMSCNLRELIHIYKLRTNKSAQEEIRQLVNKMVELVVLREEDLSILFKEEL